LNREEELVFESEFKSGEEALRLINQLDPYLNKIRGSIYIQIERTKHNQNDERDELWRKLQMVNWVKDSIKSVITTGKMAESSLKNRILTKLGI
jgi:SMC interacting uncharacterized protein involved in chromosome segregation